MDNNKNKNLIEKSNSLVSMYELPMTEKMSLTEFRFFCLYLSRLNARNPNNRTVIISISEFEKLFDVKFNTTLFTKKIYQILKRSMVVKNDKGKTEIINLYSKFGWYGNNYKQLEITCNYDIVPFIFELKKNYTTYRIANIIKLNSVSKIRLYELCKQYEKLKKFVMDLTDLLKIMQSDIMEFRFFSSKVLKPAIRDINEYTDITVSYEKILSCRKVVALSFNISRKDNYIEIIPEPETELVQEPIPVTEPTEAEINTRIRTSAICDESSLETLYLKCDKEYTLEELFNLFDYVSNAKVSLNISIENYIYSIYRKIKIEGKPVKNLYKYTFAIIENQMTAHIFNDPTPVENTNAKTTRKKKDTSYDIYEFCQMVEVHEA